LIFCQLWHNCTKSRISKGLQSLKGIGNCAIW